MNEHVTASHEVMKLNSTARPWCRDQLTKTKELLRGSYLVFCFLYIPFVYNADLASILNAKTPQRHPVIIAKTKSHSVIDLEYLHINHKLPPWKQGS